MRSGGFRFILPTLLLLVACAPVIGQPGPAVIEAHLTDKAITTQDGYSLPLRSWTPLNSPPTAVLIALHGFNDYSNFFQAQGAYFAKHGILTYAYDQRGFGETSSRGFWSGTQAYLDDLKAATEVIRKRHGDIPLFVLGESMGGAVVLAAMSHVQKPDVDGVILSAPAVWGRETMPFYQRWALSFISHTTPWLKLTGQGLKIKPSNNIEMLRALGRDPLVIKETRIDAIFGLTNLMDLALAASKKFESQSLILYGMKDQIVPKPSLVLMVKRLPQVAKNRQRLAIYNRGYHMLLRDLNAEIFWNDIVTWIKNPNIPLPSRADIDAYKNITSEFIN